MKPETHRLKNSKERAVISMLLSKGLPFVAWRFPQSEQTSLLVSLTDKVPLIDLKRLDEVQGFVVASFESAKTGKVFVLQPGLFYNTFPDAKELERLPAVKKNLRIENLTDETENRAAYLKRAAQVIADLKKGKLKKLVLSRVIDVKTDRETDPGLLLAALNDLYGHSFNYLGYLPEAGIWVGATPELFFKKGDEEAEMMSLAGTKPAGTGSWSHKELEEQAIVTDFIEQQLKKKEIKFYKVTGPDTLVAGNVEHLVTKIRIPLNELTGKAGDLIGSLHPTPAVCGMPQQKALEHILKTEGRQRMFYTGFLGPWQLNGQTELYVNLRCARLGKKTVRIYVGGGLTASSVPESEWDETEYKSKTLLSVIENL